MLFLLFWKAESQIRAVDQRCSLSSCCQSDEAVIFWFGVCLFVCLILLFSLLFYVFPFLFYWVLLYSSLLSDTISLYTLTPSTSIPHQLLFFRPFICLDFPILVSIQSVPYFSGCCSFWANRMLLSCYVFKALILLLSYKTKLDVAVGLLFTVYFSLCCTG